MDNLGYWRLTDFIQRVSRVIDTARKQALTFVGNTGLLDAGVLPDGASYIEAEVDNVAILDLIGFSLESNGTQFAGRSVGFGCH